MGATAKWADRHAGGRSSKSTSKNRILMLFRKAFTSNWGSVQPQHPKHVLGPGGQARNVESAGHGNIV